MVAIGLMVYLGGVGEVVEREAPLKVVKGWAARVELARVSRVPGQIAWMSAEVAPVVVVGPAVLASQRLLVVWGGLEARGSRMLLTGLVAFMPKVATGARG